MQPIRIGTQFQHFSEIDSTNTWLLRHAGELPSGTVATADFQTAGRGRFNRAWQADRSQSLLLSVLIHVAEGDALVRDASWLSGIACVRAIERAADVQVRLRWPNDMCIDDRKCGGILVETTSLPTTNAPAPRRRAVVIGIGINCNQKPGAFPPELAQKATSLAMAVGQPIDRDALRDAILHELQHAIDAAHDATPLAALRQAWRDACCDMGRETTLLRNGVTVRGIVRSIADDGDLLVEVSGGEVMRFEAATTTRLWPHETA